MNILITGANGQLGTELRQLVASHPTNDHYLFTDVAELDITNLEAVRHFVQTERVELLVNCAAYTNVDRAETTDQKLCERINHHAVAHLATAMQEVGGWLIHISTDYVFGREPYNKPCGENQQGTPTGIYGAAKLRGEEAIRAVGVQHLIFRTAWLYSPYGKNFLNTMLRLTAQQEQVRVVFDQVGTPTYAADLAAAIHHIITERKYVGHAGTYHYSNEGACSWYDFAHAIAQLAGHTSCRVEPCHSHEYPSPVERPAYSVLDKTKFKETFKLPIAHWHDALAKCLEQMKLIS